MTAWPRTVTPFEVSELGLPGPLISKSQGGKVQVRSNLQIGRTWRESYLLKVSQTADKGFLAQVRNFWRNGELFTIQHVDYTAIKGVGGGSPLVNASTQLVDEPEDFSTYSLDNTPTLTTGQTDPFRGTAASLLTDNDAGTVESIYRTVTFTGNAEKAFAVFMKQGSSAGSWFRIRDSTAGTDRHQVSVTWTAGVPSLSTSGGAGTLYAVEDYGEGWYRLLATATGIIAANTNVIQICPTSTTASQTGTTYIFGANAWNSLSPSRYSGDSVPNNDATGNRLHIDGATASTSNWLRGGDLFSVPVGSLNYVLEAGADVHTQANGYAMIPITPPLFTGGAPADNAALTLSGVQMRCVLLEPPTWPTTSGSGADYGELSCVFGEAL